MQWKFRVLTFFIVWNSPTFSWFLKILPRFFSCSFKCGLHLPLMLQKHQFIGYTSQKPCTFLLLFIYPPTVGKCPRFEIFSFILAEKPRFSLTVKVFKIFPDRWEAWNWGLFTRNVNVYFFFSVNSHILFVGDSNHRFRMHFAVGWATVTPNGRKLIFITCTRNACVWGCLLVGN